LRKDGDFAWWSKVWSKIEGAKLRDAHRTEEASKLQDRWCAKGKDKVWLWSRSSLDIGSAQPWRQSLRSEREMWLEEHPPWQTRYNPVEGIWHCLEYDTLPVPDYMEADRDGMSSQKFYDWYYREETLRFKDSDFTILCGGAVLSTQRELAAILDCHHVVQRQRPAEPLPSYHLNEAVSAGLNTLRLPSLGDVFARVGLTWRDTKKHPVVLRAPLNHCWCEGVVVNNRIPQPGEATDLEVALQTIGLSTSSLPTGNKDNALAIVARQASQIGLTFERAVEMIKFVTRMSNARHNLRHEEEMKKMPCLESSGTLRKSKGKLPASVPVSMPFDPPYNRPVSSSWLFLPDDLLDTWAKIAKQNDFEFMPATCFKSPVPSAERSDSPAWLIDLPGQEYSWRLVVHQATFVCQILWQRHFRSIEEIVQYALECGIRISTVAPREDINGEHHKVKTELCRKELANLRIGYRDPGAKVTVSEFESFMRTCKRKLASDETIA
jgi:hypothetical protein